ALSSSATFFIQLLSVGARGARLKSSLVLKLGELPWAQTTPREAQAASRNFSTSSGDGKRSGRPFFAFGYSKSATTSTDGSSSNFARSFAAASRSRARDDSCSP